MHPITRREKLKKDLTDLNFFCKESDFSLEIIVYGKLYPSFQTDFEYDYGKRRVLSPPQCFIGTTIDSQILQARFLRQS